MTDKFGNPLLVGDTVIYFSTNLYKTSHVGIILDLNNGNIKLRSEKGREIHRSSKDLIHYVGKLP